MATAPSPNDLTRQQLDELDALLQRMLSLPLSPPEQVAAPPRPTPTILEFAPLPMPAPASPVREATPPQHWRGENTPSPQLLPTPEPPQPLAQPTAPRQAPLPAPVEFVAPRVEAPPAPPPPAPAHSARPAASTQPATASPEPVPLLLVPFVAFNRVVNTALGLLGFPGRVLRSGFVKNLLGLTGFALLAYTAVKAAQVHLALPLTLPWPR